VTDVPIPVAEREPVDPEAPADVPSLWSRLPKHECVRDDMKWLGKDSLHSGKYGAPSNNALWKWYVEEGHKDVHPAAHETSTARAGVAGAPASVEGENSPDDRAGTSAPAVAAAHETWTARFLAKAHPVAADAIVPTDERSGVSRFAFTLAVADGTNGAEPLELWVPDADMDQWWNGPLPDAPPTLKVEADVGRDRVRFPIYMPSAGRANTALLDLSAALENTAAVHIIVVKHRESDEYRRGRSHMTFLVLPPSADELGIGASRLWIQRFAARVMDPAFPYCAVLDDNIEYWKGRTLPNDPHPQFGLAPTEHAQFSDISLARVLRDFADDDFVRDELPHFAIVGFARCSGRNDGAARYAYRRTHVYSAVLLNLELLNRCGVEYDPRVHIWEDIDVGERVHDAAPRGLLVKCLRYMQQKRQMFSGGCCRGVARPAPTDDAAELPTVHGPWDRFMPYIEGEKLKNGEVEGFSDPSRLWKHLQGLKEEPIYQANELTAAGSYQICTTLGAAWGLICAFSEGCSDGVTRPTLGARQWAPYMKYIDAAAITDGAVDGFHDPAALWMAVQTIKKEADQAVFLKKRGICTMIGHADGLLSVLKKDFLSPF